LKAAIWWKVRTSRTFALAIGVLTIAVIITAAVEPAWSWFSERQVLLRQRQDLLDRMRALVATLPPLHSISVDRSQETDEVDLVPVPGATDTIAAAKLQDCIQQMATDAGATLTEMETLPFVPETDRWRRISLRINLESSWPVLVKFMHLIDSSAIPILIDDIRVHRSDDSLHPGNPRLQASMILYGFRRTDMRAIEGMSPSE
jgi:general secretion pathway protein M